ncbi:hypothetical protein [Chroococcus sp. FPU101]|uniref:hypothetical protein n=1 Tax=Chroococcus sp. FPU101 TaxID=1974212 RepID=UPI001A8FA588|nr:hypothetical protein [Chroococcus sp. FPU101]GFE71148.1 hypothetical protein CFPU101_37580 [Chroococcus sp. FPU101]
MLDATLNPILENHILLTAFSAVVEQGLNPLSKLAVEPHSFSSLMDDVSLLAQTIKESVLKVDTPILFQNFANWVARLQTYQALADDFDEKIDGDLLLAPVLPQSQDKIQPINYEMAGISIDDSLLCYSVEVNSFHVIESISII